MKVGEDSWPQEWIAEGIEAFERAVS